MTLLIDTQAVQARERLDFWSESSRGAYHPVQIRSPDRERFWAQMWGYELGPLSFFRIAAAPNTMIRTSRTIASGDPECLHLEVVLRGQINAAQEGRTGIAYTGDMISYETSHPAVFRADEPFETLVVRVPKSLLGREAAAITNLTAVKLPCSDSLTRASATFFRRVAAALEAGTVSGDQATAAASRAVDLVRALYGRSQGDEPRRLRTRAEIFLSVESFIGENLGDPHLSPEDIARASFVSTRYLHKLFESEGTSVCRWIRDARLEACRRDLLDPALAHQTILAIASRWGLPVPQHFSRLFRAAYGCSPREFRRDASRAGRRPASGMVA
ncbi:MAG TPA: helix-turn-helix domain-containing protein [Gaiellaceae bacterium]|nr:helix-turn-helix domain-containing protein [Gaiellaceae bacterium]